MSLVAALIRYECRSSDLVENVHYKVIMDYVGMNIESGGGCQQNVMCVFVSQTDIPHRRRWGVEATVVFPLLLPLTQCYHLREFLGDANPFTKNFS